MKRTHLFPLFLILYEAVLNLSNDLYLPALPTIGTDLGVSFSLMQLTITFWFAGDASLQLFIGPFSDRFGRRTTLFGGSLLFLLATLLATLTSSFPLLLLARFFQGVGVASFMIAGYTSVHEFYGEKEAIQLLAWMGAISVMAPMLGPTLGSLLLFFGSWRLLFALLFLCSLITLIPLWRLMPETNKSPDHQALHFRSLLQNYKKILFHKTFFWSTLAYGALYSSLIVWITASPHLLMETLGLSPLAFGLMQIPIFGAFIAGAWVLKLVLVTREPPLVISRGLALVFGSALALLIFTLVGGRGPLVLLLPLCGIAFGYGLSSSALNRRAFTALAEKKGSVVALFYLFMVGMGTLSSLFFSFSRGGMLALSRALFLLALIALMAEIIYRKK